MHDDMAGKPKDNITAAWFFGIMGAAIVLPYWYAAFQFDPPFRMMGGKDVRGSPGSYFFGAVLFGTAAFFWVRNWHRVLQKVRGSAAMASIVTAIFTLMSLASVFLLTKSLMLIDLRSYLSGEHPTQWYAWRKPAEEPQATPIVQLSNIEAQIRCGTGGEAPTQTCFATVTKDPSEENGRTMIVQMPDDSWWHITFRGTTPTEVWPSGEYGKALRDPPFTREGILTTVRYGSETFVVADGHLTGW